MANDLPLSVWATAQVSPRYQRADRTITLGRADPGMLPEIARYAIATYSLPGALVLDPCAGAGATLVEAVHLGRDAIGIEYPPPLVALAGANLEHARADGATGHGEVVQGDARYAASIVDPAVRGLVALVLCALPSPETMTPGRTADVNASNAAALLDAMRAVLRECAALLAPRGFVVMTAHPYWHEGRLIDLPGALGRIGEEVGLVLYERNVALGAALRDDSVVAWSSPAEDGEVRGARAAGIPRLRRAHDDVLVWRAP